MSTSGELGVVEAEGAEAEGRAAYGALVGPGVGVHGCACTQLL